MKMLRLDELHGQMSVCTVWVGYPEIYSGVWYWQDAAILLARRHSRNNPSKRQVNSWPHGFTRARDLMLPVPLSVALHQQNIAAV
jgi:hypothetical protein